MRNYPPRYIAPKTEAPDAGQVPEILRQAVTVIDEALQAIEERDASKAVERLRRLEEIAVHARYVVLATR